MKEAAFPFLAAVLVLLFFFPVYEYAKEGRFEDSPIDYKISKESSFLVFLSKDDIEGISQDPAKKIIAGIKIDVNTADWYELSFLPGISDEIAKNIIKYRKLNGRFRRLEELMNVKGIKKKRLKNIQPFIEL